MDTKVVWIKGRRGGSGARRKVRMKVINGLIDMQLGDCEHGKTGWREWSHHLLKV